MIFCFLVLALKSTTSLSLLNYVPFVAIYLRAFVFFVPTYLRVHLPTYLRSVISCLRAVIFHVIMCVKPLISTPCNNASNQLNVIGRIQKYMDFKDKYILLNSSVCSNYKYCSLVWHFCSSKSLYKVENIQERALRLLTQRLR